MNYKKIAGWNTAAAFMMTVSASSLAFHADQVGYGICFAIGAAFHTITIFAMITDRSRS